MRKLSFLVLLILILLIAAFFRLWQIDKAPPGLYPDEAMNGNNALEALETGKFKIFYQENNGREGLFINIQTVSLAVFGNKPWALRAISSIFGILTVLGLFFLTKLLFEITRPQIKNENLKVKNQNEKLKNFKFLNVVFTFSFLNFKLKRNEIIALLSSFLLATSFWHINFSRIGFRAIMAPAFLVWSLFLLLKSLNQTKKNFQPPNPKSYILYSIFSGLIYGLGFYSYIAYRITPVLIAILIFGYWFSNRKIIDNKKLLFSIFYFLFSAIIVVFPLVFYFYNNPGDFLGRTSQISIFSSENPLVELGKNILKTAGMFWWNGDYNWRHNYSGSPQLFWPVGILFGLGIIISIFKLLNFQFSIFNFQSNSNDLIFKQKESIKNSKIKNLLEIRNWKLEIGNKNILPEIVLFSWLIIGLLPVVISSESIPHALRAIIILPPVMLISAIGLEWLISKIQNWLAIQKNRYSEYSRRLDRIKKELIVLLFAFFIAVIANSFNQYFIRWLSRPEVENAFNKNYVEIGNYLNSLPNELPKYALVNASGIDVRGIPMPAQTVMFMTKTFLPKWQDDKNIHYLVPKIGGLTSEVGRFTSDSEIENGCAKNCVVTMLENDSALRQELKEKIPGLRTDASPGFVILIK